jgi:hypothetical protein
MLQCNRGESWIELNYSIFKFRQTYLRGCFAAARFCHMLFQFRRSNAPVLEPVMAAIGRVFIDAETQDQEGMKSTYLLSK